MASGVLWGGPRDPGSSHEAPGTELGGSSAGRLLLLVTTLALAASGGDPLQHLRRGWGCRTRAGGSQGSRWCLLFLGILPERSKCLRILC